MRRAVLIAAAMVAAVSGGCVACGHKECPVCNPPTRAEEMIPVESGVVTAEVRSFDMPAADLVKHLEKALQEQGLTIASSESGVIQTGWKDYPGEFHIARRWQERSRFRISVIPDANDPTTRARFEVAEETQRRSNEKAAWEPAGRRSERATQLAAAISPR